MDLLSVPTEEREFLTVHFLPAIRSVAMVKVNLETKIFHARSATSGHYLGLNDRLQLGTDLLASCAKLLYAFLWQVEITLIMILLSTDFRRM